MNKRGGYPWRRIVAICILGLLLLTVIATALWVALGGNMNGKAVEPRTSLLSNQTEIDNSIKADGYTISQPNIILNPYKISPLTAVIAFHTDTEVSPTVTIHGKDNLTTFINTFNKSTDHYLPIYGLYPATDNKVTISYQNNNETVSKDIVITTAKLPEKLALPTSVTADKSKLGTGNLYFYTPSSSGYTAAYDINGDVRWYLTEQLTWNIDQLANGHLLLSTERQLNAPYYTTGLYEIDLLGKIYVEYSLPGGYHHDYYEMPNGNLLVASDNFAGNTVEDTIVEVDRQTGKIVKSFDLTTILPTKLDNNENWISYDWFHNNSVWYDGCANSIILSGRHMDTVIAIDYSTGQLKWIIGDPTGWSEEYQRYFFTPIGDNFEWQWSQHAAMVTPEGYIFLFDNGNNKSKNKDLYVPAENSYSRGVMYQIDTNTMTIRQLWQYGKERSSAFYSPYISNVDYLANDHYLVHSGGIVYVNGKNSNQPAGFSEDAKLVADTVEVLNNQVIFELKLPTNAYRARKLPVYPNNQQLQLSYGKYLGNLGQTTVNQTEKTAIMLAAQPDKDYNSHQLELTREVDRLVIKGKFKRGQKIQVILRQNFTNLVYDMRVSKKPYTALCVDIFTEQETRDGIVVNKYINSDHLAGKYSIYIKIDGKLYNTGQYVKF